MANGKTLIEANPHLKDPKKREDAIVNFVHGMNKLEGLSVPKEKTREHYQTISAKPIRKSRSKLAESL